MPTLTVFTPIDGASVPRELLVVTGQASDRGGTEPVMIDSVTVQVDDAAPVRATLQHLHDPHLTVVAFTASIEVTGAEGAHTITVVATNDSGLTRTEAVTVYLGPSLDIGAPAIRLEIKTPAPVDPAAPSIVSALSSLQHGLGSVSSTLAGVGRVLAGPNAVVGHDDNGAFVLRIGLWIESSGIAVQPPAPPTFPLPRLADATAQVGFALVPVAEMPRRTGFTDLPFAVSIDTSAMQELVNASLGASSDNRINSIYLTVSAPETVTTEISATGVDGLVPVTATITEKLSTAPVAGANPPVDGPTVTHTVSTSVGDLPDWIAGSLTVVLGLALLIGWQEFSRAADAAGQDGSVASYLAADLPTSIPFHNTDAPALAVGHDFPVLVADWVTFEATGTGIHGAGDALVLPRTQDMVGMSIDGPDFVRVPPGEPLAGGVLTVTLSNLAPDDGAVAWQLWSSIDGSTTAGTLHLGSLAQTVSLDVDFPMPLHISPGDYHYVVSVSATETCGTDPAQILTGAATKQITVRKPASTGHLPHQPGQPSPVTP